MKIAIIGGGIGGLSCAALLAQDGHEVELFEQHDRLYGRAHTFSEKGFRFDAGPSWYLMPEVFEHFFGLFGKKTTDYYDLLRLEPAYKVFFDYQNPVTISGDLAEDKKTFDSIEPGAGQKLEDYVASAEKTYSVSVNDILYEHKLTVPKLATAVNKKTAASLLPLITQNLDSYVKKRFKSLPLQQILEYPAVFLGASPFRTPALFHLMSYIDFKQGVFYPKQGMYQVLAGIEKLARQQGVKIHTDSAVEKIITKDRVVRGIKVNGKELVFDHVVSNADLHFTETKLLEPQDRSYNAAYWQRRQAGPSALLVYLGVDRTYADVQHHNLYFVKEWKKNFTDIFDKKTVPDEPSIYVCRPTASDDTVAPKGCDNLFVLVPLPAKKQPKEKYNSLVEHVLDNLEEKMGIEDLRDHIVYKKVFTPDEFSERYGAWESTALGMAHTLRQSAMFRPNVKSKKVQGLYYVGAHVQPGIGLPMCLISAQHVQKHIQENL